jgi:hypothetical protein
VGIGWFSQRAMIYLIYSEGLYKSQLFDFSRVRPDVLSEGVDVRDEAILVQLGLAYFVQLLDISPVRRNAAYL